MHKVLAHLLGSPMNHVATASTIAILKTTMENHQMENFIKTLILNCINPLLRLEEAKPCCLVRKENPEVKFLIVDMAHNRKIRSRTLLQVMKRMPLNGKDSFLCAPQFIHL